MKGMLHLSTAMLLAGALGMATVAVAQQKAPPVPKTNHVVASPRSTAPKSTTHDTFRGIASKLNTTPEALESAYAAAKQANPKLTRGQFVAANMLAHNLGEKNPGITTQAILDGLKSGKSIGQTLQSLGLSAKDAAAAQRQADREAKTAAKQTSAPAHKPDSASVKH